MGFVSLFGLRLFPADYWVIDLAPDYSYAVVGHPSRNYGWVLSRTPTLPEGVLAGIRQRLEAQGYDWPRFRMIEQGIHVGTGTARRPAPSVGLEATIAESMPLR